MAARTPSPSMWAEKNSSELKSITGTEHLLGIWAELT